MDKTLTFKKINRIYCQRFGRLTYFSLVPLFFLHPPLGSLLVSFSLKFWPKNRTGFLFWQRVQYFPRWWQKILVSPITMRTEPFSYVEIYTLLVLSLLVNYWPFFTVILEKSKSYFSQWGRNFTTNEWKQNWKLGMVIGQNFSRSPHLSSIWKRIPHLNWAHQVSNYLHHAHTTKKKRRKTKTSTNHKEKKNYSREK